MPIIRECLCVFFFNDTATTEIYTLSLHDALPIFRRTAWYNKPHPTFSDALAVVRKHLWAAERTFCVSSAESETAKVPRDRKSTRLNSSHANISYAVFCLKKKNIK